MAGKTIIFCADGTWCGPDQDPDQNPNGAPEVLTNVLKLFRRLAADDASGDNHLADEQERTLTENGDVKQIAKYLHGVGDSSNPIVKLLGGTVGMGLIAQIVRGYTFISRHYQAGDAIVISGFSRGAYTARALAGMIDGIGLLRPELCPENDKENGYRRGFKAWLAYRRTRLNQEGFFERLGELAECWDAVTVAPLPADPWVKVESLGAVAVWDTVGSLGIPEYMAMGGRRDLFQFADTRLSPSVLHGFQCVAIDERRADFTPTLWEPDPRVIQVLHAGSHSDVGGGFDVKASGLSDITLLWIIDQLDQRVGVRFADDPDVLLAMDSSAGAHDPARDLIWRRPANGPRVFEKKSGLHLARAVLDRFGNLVTADPTDSVKSPYDPVNLGEFLVAGLPAPGIEVESYPYQQP